MYNYQNGNAQITLLSDGTRTIEYPDGQGLKLEYPLNIDIRVSTKCAFGQRPDGSYVLCDFCHEGAKTKGYDCDYELLKSKLIGLPGGIELAIGCNELTNDLIDFLRWGKSQDYVCNLTINQGHIKRDLIRLNYCIKNDLVKGIGVSFRPTLAFDIHESVLDYQNTVFHVIAGIDKVEEVLALKQKGVRKLLILGEKDFGFNTGHVYQQDINPWLWKLPLFLNQFEVLSFDNLALEQLKVQRLFLNDKDFDVFNQEEHSFYIDAANQFFAPSSRNPKRVDINKYSIKEYFSRLEEANKNGSYKELGVLNA